MTIRRKLLLCVVLVATFAGLGVAPTFASSHREAPLAGSDPQIDATDLYAFVSPDAPDTVTLISNWIPFESPAGGPNFYPWAENTKYDVNIDINGDTKADITYRWTFTTHYKSKDTFLYNTGPVNSLTDPTLNFTQTYNLERIAGGQSQTLLSNVPSAPSDVGATANSIIGVWTTAERPSMTVQAADGTKKLSGADVQVARLGSPLVNEVVVPVGFKDYFNGSQPSGDAAYLPKVVDPELPKVI